MLENDFNAVIFALRALVTLLHFTLIAISDFHNSLD